MAQVNKDVLQEFTQIFVFKFEPGKLAGSGILATDRVFNKTDMNIDTTVIKKAQPRFLFKVTFLPKELYVFF